ncbi:trem-like transcript 4 protein isoform X3 [Talpa occidentalis]|uniref:trem-like transcript 4 protein isoform X3 n=1 Tax=Talpa occidentalis TaxID=50954 RepID=UPI0023FA49CE|nr:trem-like transcript 4 protein isoform X3 [Talpa occidentalis]
MAWGTPHLFLPPVLLVLLASATTTSPVMTSTWLPSTTVPVTSPEGTFGPPSTHASEPSCQHAFGHHVVWTPCGQGPGAVLLGWGSSYWEPPLAVEHHSPVPTTTSSS